MRSWLTFSLLLLLAVPAMADKGRRPWTPHSYGHRPPAFEERCDAPPAHWHRPYRGHYYGPVYRHPAYTAPQPVYIPVPPPPLPPPPPPVMIHIRLGF